MALWKLAMLVAVDVDMDYDGDISDAHSGDWAQGERFGRGILRGHTL